MKMLGTVIVLIVLSFHTCMVKGLRCYCNDPLEPSCIQNECETEGVCFKTRDGSGLLGEYWYGCLVGQTTSRQEIKCHDNIFCCSDEDKCNLNSIVIPSSKRDPPPPPIQGRGLQCKCSSGPDCNDESHTCRTNGHCYKVIDQVTSNVRLGCLDYNVNQYMGNINFWCNGIMACCRTNMCNEDLNVTAGQSISDQSVTRDKELPGTPSISYLNMTSDVVTAGWTKPLNGKGAVRGYTLSYSIAQTPGDNEIQIGKYQLSYSFSGLRPGTEYKISIRAFNNLGSGIPANITVKTQDAAMGCN